MAILKLIILGVSIPSVFCQNLPRQLGDQCTKDQECTFENSICFARECICKWYFFEQNGQCVTGINAGCETNSECKTPKTECKSQRCRCQSDHVAVSVIECKPNAESTGQICTSTENRCLPKLQYNETCTNSRQCSVSVPQAICRGRSGGEPRCQCGDSYHFDGKKCLLNKLVSQICDVGECITPHSHCFARSCKCNPGYLQVGVQCVSVLGLECEKDLDCDTEIFKCTNKKCECKENFFELDGECAKGINAKCSNDDECKSTNSECREAKCQCKSKFVGTSVSKCLPVSQHEKECQHDVQCSAELAHTFCNFTKGAATGVCSCEEAYLFQKDKCYQKKWFNDTCTDKDDVCVTLNSHCNDGKCVCLSKFPNLVDETCSSSIIIRPLFSIVALVLLALKVIF